MLLDKFDNLLLVFCKLLFSPILMVCRKRRADICNPQAFICKQTVFIICLFKAPNPLLQGRGLSGMRFDKTGFSISPVEQITCKISRSRLVIRSDKRNRHALQLSVNCHDREMLYHHLQNALAVIFIMDAHNDNSAHPQLAQSFNVKKLPS